MTGTLSFFMSEPPDRRGQVTKTNVVQGYIETSPETSQFHQEDKLAKHEGQCGLWPGEKLRCQTWLFRYSQQPGVSHIDVFENHV